MDIDSFILSFTDGNVDSEQIDLSNLDPRSINSVDPRNGFPIHQLKL